jgi:hypothetical protein
MDGIIKLAWKLDLDRVSTWEKFPNVDMENEIQYNEFKLPELILLSIKEVDMYYRSMNCWEYKKCGREVGGSSVQQLGVCPAALDLRWDGINGGINAGRFCWYVVGTFCDGDIQGTFAAKYRKCIQCEFFLKVDMESGKMFKFTKQDIKSA